MRRFIMVLIMAAIVQAFVVPVVSYSADSADVKILDSTVQKYIDSAKQWEPVIKKYAERLFWILVTISLIFTFCYRVVGGGMSLGDFFVEFVQFTITVGFFYWLLQNGSKISGTVLNSMARMGREASSTYVLELTPSNICTFGFSLIMDSIEAVPKVGLAMGILIVVLSLAIGIVFAVIAAQMVILLITSWILIYAGTFYLGFGGSRWTSDMAVNYFKTVLGLAMQLFTFCLLVGIGQTSVASLIREAQQVKTVEVNKVWSVITGPSEVQTTAITVADGCVILIFAIVLMMLVEKVPGFVAGVVSGSSTGGIRTGGVGSGVGAVTGAIGTVAAASAATATAGVMMAAQASGAVKALDSAFSLSKTRMEHGEGRFEGKDRSGGGLGATMNRGMTFAGDMLANLHQGAAREVDGNLRRKSMGGHLSGHIDAQAVQEDRIRDAKKEEAGAQKTAESSLGGMAAAEQKGGDSQAGGEGVFNEGGSVSGASHDLASLAAALDSTGLGKAPASNGGEVIDPATQARIDRFGYDPDKIGLPDDL